MNPAVLRASGLGALLVLPWLWPWAPGPSSQVVPWMGAWACGLLAAAWWLVHPGSREQGVRIVAGAWIVAAAISCAIGLLQWFGLSEGLPGVHATPPGEAFANLRQRNQFATLASIGWLAVLVGHAWRPRPALAWQLAVVLLALGSAASVSRTGTLQWVAICALAMLRPASRRLALVGLVSYGVGVLALPALLQAWQDVDALSLARRFGGEAGCGSRTVLWSNVLHLIAQRPWTGWGAGELDYAHYATLYPGARFCDILDNAHNLPLHLAVEFGVPLAAAVCGAVLWGVARARPWREREPSRVLAWGVLAAIALHSLLEYPLWYGPFQLAALLAIALLLPARAWPTWTRLAGGAGIAVAGVALAWMAGGYQRTSQAYLPPEQRQAAFRADPLYEVRPGPFTGHARFAELALTPLNPGTAARVHALSGELLHFSPEPRVITARIESAVMLGDDADALWHLQRFKAAFPREHAFWSASQRLPAD